VFICIIFIFVLNNFNVLLDFSYIHNMNMYKEQDLKKIIADFLNGITRIPHF